MARQPAHPLRRRPGVARWLFALRAAGGTLPRSSAMTNTAQLSRDLGYTEEVVRLKSTGAEITLSAARALGPDWPQLTEFTGRDRITGEGLQVLDTMR